MAISLGSSKFNFLKFTYTSKLLNWTKSCEYGQTNDNRSANTYLTTTRPPRRSLVSGKH